MEIAFLPGGTKRTASDQSKSSGTASGSLRIAASISSSVKAATAAQSVFPRRGSSRDTTVIFSSFVFAGTPRRNNAAPVFADRAGDCDFLAMDIPEYLIPDLTLAIWSADERE